MFVNWLFLYECGGIHGAASVHAQGVDDVATFDVDTDGVGIQDLTEVLVCTEENFRPEEVRQHLLRLLRGSPPPILPEDSPVEFSGGRWVVGF